MASNKKSKSERINILNKNINQILTSGNSDVIASWNEGLNSLIKYNKINKDMPNVLDEIYSDGIEYKKLPEAKQHMFSKKNLTAIEKLTRKTLTKIPKVQPTGQPAPTVETSSEQQTGETTKAQTRQSTPEQPVINRQAEAQIEKPSIQKQLREKFSLKSESKPEPQKPPKAGFFSEKAFISNFDENFSLTNARKRQLLETKWNKTLDEISPGAKRYTDKSMKMAMEKFSNDYNLDVDLSNYKTSMLGRIANRVRGNKNISKEEALERTLGAYSKKTNEYINNLKEQYQSGKITDRQYIRRANRGWTRAAANGGERVPKSRSLGKLGWKGKGLAAVGLVALGGVISNMFSGGKKSNAELYNPNPQPQYYS